MKRCIFFNKDKSVLLNLAVDITSQLYVHLSCSILEVEYWKCLKNKSDSVNTYWKCLIALAIVVCC